MRPAPATRTARTSTGRVLKSRAHRPGLQHPAKADLAPRLGPLASLLTLLLLVAPGVPGSPALARTILVAPDGSGEYLYISHAILAAGNGDTVLVAAGRYRDRLYYGGRTVTVRSLSGPEVTVVDADSTGSVVVMDVLEGPGSVLEGFTLCGGTGTRLRRQPGDAIPAPGSIGIGRPDPGVFPATIDDEAATPDPASGRRDLRLGERTRPAPDGGRVFRFGGGILLLGASPTLRNLVIEGNGADYGGGIYALQGRPSIVSCTMRKNLAGWGGGAFFEMTDQAELQDCTFRANLGVRGVGLALLQGSAHVEGGRFSDNTGAEGGALHLLDSTVISSFAGTIFNHNQAGEGSALLCDGGAFELRSCTLTHNGLPGIDPAAVYVHPGSSGNLLGSILAIPLAARNLAVQGAPVSVECCDLWPPDDPGGPPPGNISAPPLFCDPARGLYTLAEGSPCLPEQAPPGCGLIGALPRGCTATGGTPDSKDR